MTDGEAAAYIAAFIDGEGHIGCHRNRSGTFTRTIEVANCDFDLLDDFCALLDQLGFIHREYIRKRPPSKENWRPSKAVYIRINRQTIQDFKSRIPIKSASKKAALDAIIASYIGYERAYADRRNGHLCHCCQCGTEMYRSLSRIKEKMFCSHECRAAAQLSRILMTCQECGITFEAVPSRVNKGYAKYCSHRCARLHDRDRMALLSSAAAKARWEKSPHS